MNPWNNNSIIAYHGSTLNALKRYAPEEGAFLNHFTVQLKHCSATTDFGRGFYLTTSLKQAQSWANLRVEKSPKKDQGLVLQYELDRNWLASLEGTEFVRPCKNYWSFVTFCRTGKRTHKRQGSQRSYDYVAGPLSLFPQPFIIQDCDQYSFNTKDACEALPKPLVSHFAKTSNHGRFIIHD